VIGPPLDGEPTQHDRQRPGELLVCQGPASCDMRSLSPRLEVGTRLGCQRRIASWARRCSLSSSVFAMQARKTSRHTSVPSEVSVPGGAGNTAGDEHQDVDLPMQSARRTADHPRVGYVV
jgi:hypothetical protein